MTYILSPKRGEHYTAEELSVSFPAIMRATGRKLGGLFSEVEQVGRDEQKVEVFPRGDDFRRATGLKTGARIWITARRSPADVHKRVRRLRPRDVEAIAAVDAEIEALQQQINEKRRERAALVKEAWPRGQELRLKELIDLIPEAQRRQVEAA